MTAFSSAARIAILCVAVALSTVSFFSASFAQQPEQFAALMAADFAKFAEIIKTANIRID